MVDKIYPHGEHPRRVVLGILYILNSFVLGIAQNPLTPLSATIRKVTIYFSQK
jgi:hypothetical protein